MEENRSMNIHGEKAHKKKSVPGDAWPLDIVIRMYVASRDHGAAA